MKNIIFSLTLLFLLIGCGAGDSSDDSSSKVKIWEYLVPNKSLTLLFDKIITVDGKINSKENEIFFHEYNFVNNREVRGRWRDSEGEYSIKIENDFIKYAPIETNPNYSWSSGSFRETIDVGMFLYRSDGDYGTTSTSSGITSSFFVRGLDCVVNKVYDNLTLYDSYSYKNVLEVKCETRLDQEYGDSRSPQIIEGIDRYYEYYEKNRGWIAKVNKNCIVATGNNKFDFIDDNNGTCIQTRTEYILAKDK